MIILMIMTILLIGLITVMGHSMMGFYSSAHSIEQRHNEQRLERLWEDAIMRQLRPAGPEGSFIAPLGQSIVDEQGQVIGQGLPANSQVPQRNSLGLEVRYCAIGRSSVAIDAALTLSAPLTFSQSYLIEPISINGSHYVYSSNAIPGMIRHSDSVVAFIVSPRNAQSQTSCIGIQYDEETGRYRIDGSDSRVLPIIAPHVFTPITFSGIIQNKVDDAVALSTAYAERHNNKNKEFNNVPDQAYAGNTDCA